MVCPPPPGKGDSDSSDCWGRWREWCDQAGEWHVGEWQEDNNKAKKGHGKSRLKGLVEP